MIPIEIKILIGLVTGVVVGLTGASGVVVVVPLLTIILGFSMHSAVGTSLFVDMIAPLFVAWSYYRRGNVNLKSGLWLALGAVGGAQIGALVANKALSSDFMGDGFVLFMFLMAISMWIRSGKPQKEISDTVLAEMTLKNRLITLVIGLGLGVISGLFGAGGGLMFLLVLMILLKYPTHMAIGTSSLIMAITAASGTLGYALQGNVDFSTGIILAIAAVVGGVISARLANKATEKTLNRIVAVVFFCLGIAMLFLQ
jgi:uncharacterized membrane protein YfcA